MLPELTITPTTEKLHEQAIGLDALPLTEVAQILASAQSDAAASVAAALPSICQAAQSIAQSVRDGGRLIYVGAGSSGLMAAADAMELHGTFGIGTDQVRIVMAGGLTSDAHMAGSTEDETQALASQLGDVGPADCVIAVSASGGTPFTLEAVRLAHAGKATIIAVATNDGAPLFAKATHTILLQTPPEVVAGSTRMGGGTAQKIALNMLSTLMAIALGHVHDGMMVNLVADNAKLKARAAAMVATIAKVSEHEADRVLQMTEGRVKPAVLLAAGAASARDADVLLTEAGGNLRAALARLTQPENRHENQGDLA